MGDQRQGSPEKSSDNVGIVGDPESALVPEEEALLGARHDLHLAGRRGAVCRCLAVAVGAPGDPRFQWDGGPRAIDTASQVVIALTSRGVPCPEASENDPGASYWGYQVSGSDVIVIVEQARRGRPLTEGAIIPRPGPRGRVLVRPAAASVPYGAALGGGGLCVASNGR